MSSPPPDNAPPSAADLEAAYEAAKACLEACAFTQAWFHAEAVPPVPAADLHESIAHAWQNLTDALEKLPLVEKVEHYLAAAPVQFAGAGMAASAHRAAFQLAHWARCGIWFGLRNAASDDLMELGLAVERSNGKVIDPALKKLCDEHDAALDRFRAMSQNTRAPLTAEDVADLWCSRSWGAIRAALGDPLSVEDDALAVTVDSEYLRAKRFAGRSNAGRLAPANDSEAAGADAPGSSNDPPVITNRPRPVEPPAGANEFLSPADLATRYGADPRALEARLRRWRGRHPDEAGKGWIEVPDARSRQPRYLYRTLTVLPIVNGPGAPGERRAK